jgi:hypothetical protein
MVPAVFAAYAGVLHPATDDEGTAVRWSAVAERTGRGVHPLVQWHRLVGAAEPGDIGLWPGNPPGFELQDEQVAALVDLLAPHTTTPDECWFAWGQHRSHPDLAFPEVPIGREAYVVGRGPVRSAPHLTEQVRGAPLRQTPGIWWPADHAWCVGSDADIDSTVVGGSAAAIAGVLADPRLEALPVGPHDSLMADGDLAP